MIHPEDYIVQIRISAHGEPSYDVFKKKVRIPTDALTQEELAMVSFMLDSSRIHVDSRLNDD